MKRTLQLIFILIISLSIQQKTEAQNLYYNLGFNLNNRLNAEVNKQETPVHTSFKPILKSNIKFNSDSIVYQYSREEKMYAKHKKSYIRRKAFTEDFINLETENFRLKINPLFYLQKDYLQDSVQNIFINTRGIEIKGDIGNKLSFYSAFRENQAFFRDYTNSWIQARKVVPGQGATKPFQETGHDFSMATAYLSFTPFKWLNIQTGNDKNFIGEGYRSLLLSDNSFNSPFLKLTLNYKNFQYTTLVTEFRDFETVFYYYNFKKHGAFNYLSYNYNNKVEIGLFEGVIYKTQDTTAQYFNKYPTDFFIPVPLVRTFSNQNNNTNHLLTGLNIKISPIKQASLYGQVAVEELSKNQFAYQVGIKFYDLFFNKIKNNNLFLLVEHNISKPEIYSHDSLKYQTWTHYNQELAHPTGNNFSETILILKYSYRNLSLKYKYNHILFDKNGIYSNIYMLNNNNTFIIPEAKTVTLKNISVSWMINPRTDLQIFAGIDIRDYTVNENFHQDKYFYFGLKTNLSNFYYDY